MTVLIDAGDPAEITVSTAVVSNRVAARDYRSVSTLDLTVVVP